MWDESDERTDLPDNEHPLIPGLNACAKLCVTDVRTDIDRRELNMQTLRTSSNTSVPRSHGRSIMESFDSKDEFSLARWLYVCKLVQEADLQIVDQELAPSAGTEAVRKKPVSEVESPTAYQHFAGDVV